MNLRFPSFLLRERLCLRRTMENALLGDSMIEKLRAEGTTAEKEKLDAMGEFRGVGRFDTGLPYPSHFLRLVKHLHSPPQLMQKLLVKPRPLQRVLLGQVPSHTP